MPTLLRSNAAAGVAMGLDSHLKELDRTEAQRQFDMGRHDKARSQQLGYLQALLANPSAALAQVSDGKGRTMALGDLASDTHASNLRESTSGRWYKQENGKTVPRPATDIYSNDKENDVTYRSRKIIEGK